MTWIVWLAIGLIAGIGANYVMSAGLDLLVCIIVGVVGGLLGGWLSSQLGGPQLNGFSLISLVIAFLGAVVLIFLLRLIKTRRVS